MTVVHYNINAAQWNDCFCACFRAHCTIWLSFSARRWNLADWHTCLLIDDMVSMVCRTSCYPLSENRTLQYNGLKKTKKLFDHDNCKGVHKFTRLLKANLNFQKAESTVVTVNVSTLWLLCLSSKSDSTCPNAPRASLSDNTVPSQ